MATRRSGELLDAAHARGIRVVLDGVFNHVGRGFFPFQHVLENGIQSPYRDWFYLDPAVLAGRAGDRAPTGRASEGGPEATGYRSWWNIPSLPKLRVEHPPVREFLFGVAERLAPVRDRRLASRRARPTSTTRRSGRSSVDGSGRFARMPTSSASSGASRRSGSLGDRFDALMNYPLGIAILGFASAGRLDAVAIDGQADYARFLAPLDGPAFGERVHALFELHDPAITAVQYNLIGSHDTPRARTVLAGDAAALRLATLLLLTLPGAPSIYYGDELGMEGGPDPDCRRAYPAAPDADALAHRTFVRADRPRPARSPGAAARDRAGRRGDRPGDRDRAGGRRGAGARRGQRGSGARTAGAAGCELHGRAAHARAAGRRRPGVSSTATSSSFRRSPRSSWSDAAEGGPPVRSAPLDRRDRARVAGCRIASARATSAAASRAFAAAGRYICST